MKQLNLIILVAALLFVNCTINAQWSNAYTGTSLNDMVVEQDLEEALYEQTIFPQNPLWGQPLTVDPTADNSATGPIDKGDGVWIPGGGPGIGVAVTPVGDAMWVIVLFMGVVLVAHEYSKRKHERH